MPTPFDPKALAALQGLKTSSNYNHPELPEYDPSQLYQLQSQRAGELEDRAAGAIGAGDTQDLARIKALLGPLNRDISEGPIAQQRVEQQGIEDARSKALQAGFGGSNPTGEQAAYGRRMEAEKINAPVRAAEVQSQGELAKQQEASRGALAVQESRGAQSQNFLDMLQGANMSGLTHIGVNPQSGSVSMTQTPQKNISPATMNRLTQARGQFETAKGNVNIFNSGAADAAKAQYQQAQQSALQEMPTSTQEIKQYVQGILSDPGAENLSLDEILQATGQVDITPEEKAEMQQILTFVRGH